MKKEVKDTILSTGQKLTFIGEDLARKGNQKKEDRDVKWIKMRKIHGKYH